MPALSDALAPLLQAQAHVQVSPGVLSVLFSVLLVAWLVTAEEVELRRDRGGPT